MVEKPLERLKHSITNGNLWPYILMLSLESEIYAYVLPDLINKKFGFKPNKIMVYIVLYKLESSGYIKSKYRERRKYYSITKKGKELLKKAGKDIGHLYFEIKKHITL